MTRPSSSSRSDHRSENDAFPRARQEERGKRNKRTDAFYYTYRAPLFDAGAPPVRNTPNRSITKARDYRLATLRAITSEFSDRNYRFKFKEDVANTSSLR